MPASMALHALRQGTRTLTSDFKLYHSNVHLAEPNVLQTVIGMWPASHSSCTECVQWPSVQPSCQTSGKGDWASVCMQTEVGCLPIKALLAKLKPALPSPAPACQAIVGAGLGMQFIR